jgi:hypothetical protein
MYWVDTNGSVRSQVGEENAEQLLDALGQQAESDDHHLTDIQSPVEPDADWMWEGENELTAGNTPPPPVVRPLRPNPQTRPFNDFQEDPLGSVLDELKSCTRLSCIIRVHDKIDGRTSFNFPHFFLLGYPYSGSQGLIRFLNRHSEVDDSIPLNGSSWFNACQTEEKIGCNAKSEADYIQNFLNAKKAAERGLDMITVDASPDYVTAGGPLARKLYRYFPWAKIVLILRDPINRVLTKITKRAEDGSIVHLCEEKRQLLGCVQDYLEAGDGSYVESLEDWLTTFPAKQIHVIQWEELLESTDKVLFDLKYFLGMNVAELVGKFSMRGVPTANVTFRRGQYMRLIRQVEPEVDATLSLLQHHWLIGKKSWLSRWEASWQRVLSSCTDKDECTVDRIEIQDVGAALP